MLQCILAGAVLDTGTAVVLAGRLRVSADVLESCLVAVGFGDSNNFTSLTGSDSLDVDFARTLLALKTISKALTPAKYQKMVMQDDSDGIDTHSSARPVDLSIVFSIEVDDLVQVSTMTTYIVGEYTHIDLSAAVVLDDLVGSVVSTSTDDPCHIAGLVFFLICSQPVPTVDLS